MVPTTKVNVCQAVIKFAFSVHHWVYQNNVALKSQKKSPKAPATKPFWPVETFGMFINALGASHKMASLKA